MSKTLETLKFAIVVVGLALAAWINKLIAEM